jgi:glycosyltransferase involved in cell wall biosynthesis
VNQESPSVLLLIPAYNEEGRIGPVLRSYAEFFASQYDGKFQLVVVLNGCRDNTLGVVRAVAAEFPVVSWVVHDDPIGKGGALIEGLKLAPLADLIGYVDADGATEPPAFLDLVRHAKEADCVIGSRWLPGAVLHQMQSWKRRFLSRSFHAIVQLLFRMNIHDTQCSAKVMRREVVEKIHSSLCITDMAFDINLLYLIKRNGFTILEVPTVWTDKTGSKVNLPRDPMVMLLSAIRIRWIYSPFRGLRPLFAPMENWLYRKSRVLAPKPDPKH